MNGFEMVATVVFLITTGVTISTVVDSLYPKPHKPLNKFDAIDEELSRLHADLKDYRSAPTWYAQEINRLNEALIKAKVEQNDNA
jgi:hypothetical protein